MNQEISYSEKLFSFLFDDKSQFELTPQKEVWEIIKQNYFVVDQKNRVLENYVKEILTLPNTDRKDVLKIFVDGLINRKGNIIREIAVESEENLDITLSLFSDDKIYFIPVEKMQIKQIMQHYPQIEVHDSKSFINPQPSHRLKNLPTRFNLLEKKTYNIRTIIKPFLKKTNEVRIEDPYLPNINASLNFFRIIKLIKGIPTKLFFMDKKNYMKFSMEDESEREKRYDGLINKLNILNKRGYSFKINNVLGKGHVERYMYTDAVQIYLPGGFDFLDKYGFTSKHFGKKELRIDRLNN